MLWCKENSTPDGQVQIVAIVDPEAEEPEPTDINRDDLVFDDIVVTALRTHVFDVEEFHPKTKWTPQKEQDTLEIYMSHQYVFCVFVQTNCNLYFLFCHRCSFFFLLGVGEFVAASVPS